MKNNRGVVRALALITQLGITMLTPILLCTLLGVFIRDRAGISLIIPLIFLGIAAGYRNSYQLLKGAMKEEKNDEKEDE